MAAKAVILLAVFGLGQGNLLGELFRDGYCYNNDFTGLKLFPTIITSNYPYSDALVCFHEDGFDAPLYTVHKLYGQSLYVKCGIDEFSMTDEWHWHTGNYFPSPQIKPYNVDDCFEESFQNKTFGLLLDDYPVDFLVQGQLIPVCDISSCDTERNLTFNYVNVVPIFKSMLLGNWKRMEKEIRNFARSSNLTLTISTGTYGRLQMNNSKENETFIYLGRDRHDTLLKQLPVTNLIWKVLYDEGTHSGLALIMINNPYYNGSIHKAMERVPNRNDFIICPDVCDQIEWISWNTTVSVADGYIYCCEIKEFGKVVHYIHEFIRRDHEQISLTLGKEKDNGIDKLRDNRLVIIAFVVLNIVYNCN